MAFELPQIVEKLAAIVPPPMFDLVRYNGIRDKALGRAGYSTNDFVEDDRRACGREVAPFDNDIFSNSDSVWSSIAALECMVEEYGE